MRRLCFVLLFLCVLSTSALASTIFGQVQGVVHDAQHRPLPGATVVLRAAHSDFRVTGSTDAEGHFQLTTVPLGDYRLLVSRPGFQAEERPLTLLSGTTPVLHFMLQVGAVHEAVEVSGHAAAESVDSVTPTTLVGKAEIAATPGADRTNSLAMITDFVPGAYITHDMLHIRGGHQVSWLLDGVEIPNTNIASNLGAQIAPGDIDYLEVQRGSYAADLGDRTFGVFNVVPRSGFERHRDGELVLTAGSFLSTDDRINFGDHTERSAWYASLNGNRSDYGLAPPVEAVRHDATNGYGGLGSVLYNRTPHDQFRLLGQLRQDHFQIPYDPDPDSVENQQFNSSGLRDAQAETDGLAVASWLHTFGKGAVLQVSPFYHGNRADYRPGVADQPVATTADRTSHYGGAQVSATGEIARNTLQGGVYGFGQHDAYLFGAAFHDGSGNTDFLLPAAAAGGVAEEYLSDNWQPAGWLTVIAGVRHTDFRGPLSEQATTPRLGLAVRLPRLHWVLRGFYGQFYQPPPLLAAAGPLVQYAQASDTSFQPLHGERDEEHQFGVQIPLRGWLLDADTFRTHIRNFLDHSNIGDSSLYVPVTVDGALVRAWELTLRSPRLGRFGQAHLAYSNQIAEQRGAITGGLVCAPLGSPACDAGFTYTPVDHDQRNTLNLGFDAVLPMRLTAAANVMYGSGFVNGAYTPDAPPVDPRYPNPYLPPHTTFDLVLGRSFGERTTVSVTALNVANRRVLLDNSITFGGFHYNDPQQIYGEVRYRFHF